MIKILCYLLGESRNKIMFFFYTVDTFYLVLICRHFFGSKVELLMEDI